MKWQYWECFFVEAKTGDGPVPHLNKFGQNGWELVRLTDAGVQQVSIAGQGFEPRKYTGLFKRPVEENPTGFTETEAT